MIVHWAYIRDDHPEKCFCKVDADASYQAKAVGCASVLEQAVICSRNASDERTGL